MDQSWSLDGARAVRPRHDSCLGKPNEQPVLDHAWKGVEALSQQCRLGNSLERGIEYPVAAIRDESVAVLGPAQQGRAVRAARRGGRLDGAAGRGEPER